MPKTFYSRNLPHYQPPHATYFVTARLDGSLPKEAIERLQQERDEAERFFSGAIDGTARREKISEIRDQYFHKFEDLLNGASTGPRWLGEMPVASIVKEAMHYRDGNAYDLFAYTIMPNHIHIVFSLERFGESLYEPVERLAESFRGGARTGYAVTDLIGSLKKHTALEANKILHRAGAFWQHESYDHVVRTGEELERTIWYVLNNPVKANLVDSWEEWPWTYCKPGFL
ncbi:MAG: hypothetical protein HY961_00670 [Ignavibacteriae bacterium]|nr:hypothetical protein [Ignavibacteriota bacterium]